MDERGRNLSEPTASRLSVDADKGNMAGQAENKLDVGGGGRKGVEVHVSQVLVILTLTVPAALLCRIAL